MTNIFLLLASTTVKETGILLLAVVFTWLLRHRTAASRHLIWAAGLGSTIAILGLSSVVPAWRVIPLPAAINAANAFVAPAEVALRVGDSPTPPIAADPSSGSGGPAAPVASSTPSHRPDWPAQLLFIWGIGAVALLGRNITGRLALYRVSRSSSADTESETVVLQLAHEMGGRRRVQVRCSDDVELPMTWGILHPRILLPSDVCDWSPACRRHVLQHELAHVSRGDAATELIAQAATILLWFHPLVWLAVARMRSERERACDDRVLACGALASDYAADLLTFVTHHGFATPQGFALSFAERSNFEQRLRALLDPSVVRGVLSPRLVAVVLGFFAFLAVPLAALQRVAIAAPQRAPVQAEATVSDLPPVAKRTRVVHVVSRAVVASHQSADVGVDTLDAFAGCPLRVTSQHSDGSMTGVGDGRWIATGENASCQYALASAGTVVLNGDATAINQIAPGASLDLSTHILGEVTHLIARASATGDVSYEFTRNGQSTDFASTGGVWLKEFLRCVDRTTGFAMDHRFPLLINAGGPANVLAEVERMHTDFAKSLYLTRLIRTTPLDSSALRWIGQLVSRMSPQHMAGEVIIAVANRQHLTDDVRAEFLTTAEAIQEPNERARAQSALTQAR